MKVINVLELNVKLKNKIIFHNDNISLIEFSEKY
jgi:hypothetical protein